MMDCARHLLPYGKLQSANVGTVFCYESPSFKHYHVLLKRREGREGGQTEIIIVSLKVCVQLLFLNNTKNNGLQLPFQTKRVRERAVNSKRAAASHS